MVYERVVLGVSYTKRGDLVYEREEGMENIGKSVIFEEKTEYETRSDR